ncbi:MAG: polymer-forming cytoskeletal protein [Ferruginibacter sp.]|nr:polymer-forming cytoskeletal protein [Ferruginibacter sp.]
MFKQKTNTENYSTSTTIIGASTTIIGNIETNDDIRIDGTLIGNLVANAKIIIGINGKVEGNIDGNNAEIMGKVTGTIKISELLNIHGKANVTGDLHAGNLQIAATASFNGNCKMGANVIALNSDNEKVVNI